MTFLDMVEIEGVQRFCIENLVQSRVLQKVWGQIGLEIDEIQNILGVKGPLRKLVQ